MRKKQQILAFLAGVLLTLIVVISPIAKATPPFSALTAFNTLTDGTVVFAANWNSAIGSLYTWINTVLLPNLNAVTTLGDLYVCNGTSLQRLGIGGNANVLTADNTKALGMAWEGVVNSTFLTTKGDICSYSTSPGRLPVGTNGQVLTANSAATFGVDWEGAGAASIPSGMIIAYNPAYGGNTIPAGWSLCDGTNSTPNLIGMFVIGGQPSSSSSTANASGFGNQTINSVYSTNISHSHVQQGTFQSTNSIEGQYVGGGISVNVAPIVHQHYVVLSGNTTAVNSAPASYVLVYIQKN